MEKILVVIGFIIFCICFALAFVITNTWLIGCAIGLMILGFGWFFWDE